MRPHPFYCATDTSLSRQVAIKLFRMPSPRTPSASRFEREAKALAALNHPTINFWVQRWVQVARRFAVL